MSNRPFKLSDTFIEPYRTKEPDWGPLGEVTYLRTYSRKVDPNTPQERNEEWWETVRRVVEGTFNIQKEHVQKLKLPWYNDKAQRSAQKMYEKIFDFKFLPPGRGLWMMGTDFVKERGSAALNNPLHRDTKILTKEYGWTPIGEIEDQEVTVLSNTRKYGVDTTTSAQAVWAKAAISNFEVQPTKKITYKSRFGDTHSVIASYNHRWIRRKTHKHEWEREVTTTQLCVGDYLPRTKQPKYYKVSQQGIQHGFFLGDGTRSNGELHQFDLEKIEVLEKLFVDVIDIGDTKKPHKVVRQLPYAWGELPYGSYFRDKRYVYGFLAGYFAADGSIASTKKGKISSARPDELEQVKELFEYVGVRTANIVKDSSVSTNYKEERELYNLLFSLEDVQEDFFVRQSHIEFYRNNYEKIHKDWLKIIEIKEAGNQEVLCATVPDLEQFVIEGNCLTMNCAFISTEDIATRGSFAFEWTMDALMVGVGVGFDAKGAGHLTLHEPKGSNDIVFRIPDSREGWVESLGIVLNAYFKGNVLPEMDYSLIRPEGAPIQGFGGVASGPAPLKNLHEQIQKLFKDRAGTKITSVDIVDVMNMIGACVVAGNVRRSAEISFGFPDDHDFVTMKDYNKHPEEVMSHRWASNNSVFAEVGKTDYGPIAESIALNGEPGLIWLDNMQKYGRLKDGITWADRNVAGSNPCFSPETLITTRNGIFPIEDLVGETVDVWDGNQWVTVDNFRITGENQDILKVELHDGSVIRATPYHTFYTEDGEEKEARNLKIGDALQISNISGVHGTHKAEGAYIKGFMVGDGTSHNGKPILWLYEPKYMCERKLLDSIKEVVVDEKFRSDAIVEPGSVNLDRHIKSTGRLVKRRNIHGLSVRKRELLPFGSTYKQDFPLEVFTWDKESQADFIAGVMDADGTASDTKNGWMYQITSIHKEWLLKFQDLLKVFGVQSKVTITHKEGQRDFKDGYGSYYCKATYRLTVSQESSIVLAKNVKFERLRSFADKQTTYKVKPRFNKIVSIMEDGVEDRVYCCTVPTNHKVSIACGITTGQCSEQTLESGELCCLVETFPSRHDSYEEYKETMKYAYLYGKTVTLLPTHWEETNAVLMKNRRIGTSQSGIIDAFVKHGRRTMIEWSDNLYSYLRELDKKYADWLAIPQSIKVTSVKPSGSVSLLPGVSPGIHYPHDQYYVRRIRIPSENPLIPILREAGYEMEPNAYGSTTLERNKTMVVSFPVYEPFFEKRKDDVSIWEQMKNLVDYQNVWADNAVSITVTFKSGEADQIASVLEAYEDQLKAVSFLPISEHGYKQAPYETITKERYEEMASKITKPDFTVMTGALTAKGSVFCDGDSCEI